LGILGKDGGKSRPHFISSLKLSFITVLEMLTPQRKI